MVTDESKASLDSTLVKVVSQGNIHMTVLASSSVVTFYVRDPSSASASGISPSRSTIDINEMKRDLENGDDNRRISAMQTILAGMVNGDAAVHSLLMTIIRFIVPSKNKTLKKLLLLYLENVNKMDNEGKLRQEMILVWYLYCFCSLLIYCCCVVMPFVMISNTQTSMCGAAPCASCARLKK